MKIPKNATPEWFEKQIKKGTFDALEWVNWIRINIPRGIRFFLLNAIPVEKTFTKKRLKP